MDVKSILDRYRQACADAGIEPQTGDVAAGRLGEVWAGSERSGLRGALKGEFERLLH